MTHANPPSHACPPRARRSLFGLAVAVYAIAWGQACASDPVGRALAAGRVDRALSEQRDLEDLERIALHVLVAEARSSDLPTARGAWSALRSLGTAADDAWSALEHEPSDHYTQLVRAHALAARSALGDAPARRALRELVSSPDLAIVSLSIEALDADTDAGVVRALLESSSDDVRAAALRVIARSETPVAAERIVQLSEIARVDPVERVRDAALRALLELDASAALLQLAPLLDAAPSLRGIAFAQDVLQRTQGARDATADSLRAAARSQLERAFSEKDAALRGRAAAAWLATAEPAERPSARDRVAQQLAQARDRSLLLTLSLALGDDPRGAAALSALADGKDVPGAQAAAALADRASGPEQRSAARDRLRALLHSPQAAVRTSAAPALARILDLATARSALLDESARVRIATATAIVRALGSVRAL